MVTVLSQSMSVQEGDRSVTEYVSPGVIPTSVGAGLELSLLFLTIL